MAGIRRPNMVSSPCGNIPQKHTIYGVRNLSSKLSVKRGTGAPGSAPQLPRKHFRSPPTTRRQKKNPGRFRVRDFSGGDTRI